MFEKLLSSLPHNPNVGHQLSFYVKRVRKEESVRKVGLVFIVLAFLIQFFAFISPPQSTSASSPNDLVNGGFANAAQAASACRSNLAGYGTILANYGITCDRVASAPTVTINSDNYNKQLYSMGNLPYDLAGETPVTIPGLGHDVYVRYLWAWDSAGSSSTYQALDVTTPGGQRFFLLYACGNLVAVGFPQPVVTPTPPPPPPPKPCSGVISSEDFTACVKTRKAAANITENIANANGTTAKPNDLIRYTLYATNTGTGIVKDYIFSDNLSYVLDYSHLAVPGTGKIDPTTDNIVYPVRDMAPGQTSSVYFEVRVDSPIPQRPVSSSDPDYFNMMMVNTYGTTIRIKLPMSPVQQIETITSTPTSTSTTLPNTGPGDGLIIAAAVTAFAGFFFYRSRLLAKESTLAVKENIGGY